MSKCFVCIQWYSNKSLEKGNRKTKGKLLTGVKMLCLYSMEKIQSLEKGNRKTKGKLLTGVKMLCLYSMENQSLEKGNRKTKGKLLTGVKMLCLYSVANKSLEKGNRKTKSFSICILAEGCTLQQRMVTVGVFFYILFLAFFSVSSSYSFSGCFHRIQPFRQQLIFLNRLCWRTKLF